MAASPIKRIFLITLTIAMVFSMVACGGDETNETKPIINSEQAGDATGDNNVENAHTQDDDNANTNKGETNHLVVSELDLYGKINEDSQYVAAVVHNGNIESSDIEAAKKTYVAIYDMGEPICETEMLNGEWVKCANQNNFLYHFGVGGRNGMFVCIINNTNWEDGTADLYLVDKFDTNDITWLGDSEYSVITSSSKTYTDEYYIYGDGWEASAFDDEIERVQVRIGETEEDYFYIQAFLNNTVSKGDGVEEKITQALENNEIKNSIVVLNNSDNINDVDYTIGEERDLTEASFLQDILANKISNAYGLNLKDKDVELHMDTRYITYRGCDEDGERVVVSFDYYEGSNEYYDFKPTYDDMIEFEMFNDMFEYTDAEGDHYAYFATTGQLYIHKNGEMVGAAKTNTDDVFVALSGLFGIRP